MGGAALLLKTHQASVLRWPWGRRLAPCCPGHVTSSRSCPHRGRRTQLGAGVGSCTPPRLPRAASAHGARLCRNWAGCVVQRSRRGEFCAFLGISGHACFFPAARGCNGRLEGSLPLPKHPPPAAALNVSLPVIFLGRCSFLAPSPIRASLPCGTTAPSSQRRVLSGGGVRAVGRRAAWSFLGHFMASR